MSNSNYMPQHVAIIMDGNGRWAKKNKKSKIFAYKKGIEVVERIVRYSKYLGVKYLTVYAFSLENWNRPDKEVKMLMLLLEEYLSSGMTEMLKQGVSVKFIGDKSRLSTKIKKMINDIEYKSSHNNFNLRIALSYSARNEIANAIVKICKTNVDAVKTQSLENVEKLISRTISGDVVDPDLLIRSGGEYRLSNFLLWQIAYTEFVFYDKLWPDFTEDDFMAAIEIFNKRERRYGRY